MQAEIIELIRRALKNLAMAKNVKIEPGLNIQLGRTKDTAHGDYSSNIAMQLAKNFSRRPKDIAEDLIAQFPQHPAIIKVEIAGPGFINFFLKKDIQNQIIKTILEQKNRFGQLAKNSKRICLEFVSANPTGPLHVGHGRGAAYGASLANILKAAGYKVTTEYYVNDAGRQMDILAVSVWLRYLELAGMELKFPDNGYKGDYIWDIAAAIHHEKADTFIIDVDTLYQGVSADESASGDKEQHIDGLINNAKAHLKDNYQLVYAKALESILENIKQDLKSFRVEYDNWFSENSLNQNDSLDKTIATLEASGNIYNKDGAKWFKTTDFGDEKDRVVVRDNGLKTYYASDIAYHKQKLERGFEVLINIWGADHHGYIPRMRAAVAALGFEPNNLKMLLVQFANLYRGKEKIPMSTRSGSFVTLRELYDEVGVDAARFFYIMRKSEQHLDFDLELAKSQSNDNPVYYIQYAYARSQSVMRKLSEQAVEFELELGLGNLALLNTKTEQNIIKHLNKYQEIIMKAARDYAPHLLAFYLQELANLYHSYYNSSKFIIEDAKLRNARLCLVNSCGIVIKNSLTMLGVSAPDKM